MDLISDQLTQLAGTEEGLPLVQTLVQWYVTSSSTSYTEKLHKRWVTLLYTMNIPSKLLRFVSKHSTSWANRANSWEQPYIWLQQNVVTILSTYSVRPKYVNWGLKMYVPAQLRGNIANNVTTYNTYIQIQTLKWHKKDLGIR